MRNIKSRNPAWPGHPPGRQGGDKDPETSQTNRIHWGQCQHIFKQEGWKQLCLSGIWAAQCWGNRWVSLTAWRWDPTWMGSLWSSGSEVCAPLGTLSPSHVHSYLDGPVAPHPWTAAEGTGSTCFSFGY